MIDTYDIYLPILAISTLVLNNHENEYQSVTWKEILGVLATIVNYMLPT